MLPDPTLKTGASSADERDTPIEIYFGNPSLDLGAASLPRILPRFWVYLTAGDEQLTDWEYAILVQVLTLRESQDYELRAANLPVRSKVSSIERTKTKLRRMGLVFTQRLYYPPVPGDMPKMYAQRWDLRSLFYNLELIARLWMSRQAQLIATWNAGGRRGVKPVYTFEPDFAHQVQLPTDVALDILRDVFYPIPDYWKQQTQALVASLPTAHDMQGTLPIAHEMQDTPTAHFMRGTAPTAHEMRGHLLEDEDDEEEGAPALAKQIFAHFTARKGDPDYQPSPKEQSALRKLLAEGFSLELILAGIDHAFDRPNKPRFFTHCAAITRDLARHQQENPEPETRTQPEARVDAALTPAEESRHDGRQSEGGIGTPAGQARSEAPLIIDAHLVRAVDVYRSADRDITADLLGRFRLLASRCDAAARSAGATGGDWLADALTAALGVARPGSLLNYTDAVLNDWTHNGRPSGHANNRGDQGAGQQQKTGRPGVGFGRKNKTGEPGVNQGISEFLEKHGGLHGQQSD
ncbi:MAG: hypothetical protein ACKOC5_04835 [Chloroflexota bacterium]